MTDQPNTIVPADPAHEIPAADQTVTRAHNNPPGLLEATDLLARFTGDGTEPGQYTSLADTVSALLANIRETAPAVIETDADNGIIASHMAELRKTLKTVENHHEHEKAPYLAAGRACDQFFFEKRDRLIKARDILQKRGDAYTERKAAEARAAAQLLARQEAAKLAAAQEATRKAAQAAADLAAAAERARKPENIQKLTQAAEEQTAVASMAQVDEMIALSKTENAAIAAAQPTASFVRTRHEGGHLSTGKQVGYAEIADLDKLDLNLLKHHFKRADIEAALKKFAAINDFKDQIEGARIGKKDKADYRG